MVNIRVRETYDLHTIRNKLTLIGIHTPNPDIVKKQYPGLLMQNKYYRPLSCRVVIASAQRLPADIKSVGLTEGEVAPEDVFNPILYRAVTNQSLSTIEQRLLAYSVPTGTSVGATTDGDSATIDNNTVVPSGSEFDAYYGFLADTRGWKTANPQRGLVMNGLKPLVFSKFYNYAFNSKSTMSGSTDDYNSVINGAGKRQNIGTNVMRGRPSRLPAINTTFVQYSGTDQTVAQGYPSGFGSTPPANLQVDVPWIRCMVACILIPPSRLHELYYRMTVEWTISLSGLRNMTDVTSWAGIQTIGSDTHYIDYDYSASTSKSIMENDTAMVDTNAEIQKVM